jgi:hypothetical protein
MGPKNFDRYRQVVVTCTLFYFQDESDVIEFFKARVSHFYSGTVQKIDFSRFRFELENIGKQNSKTKDFLVSISPTFYKLLF